VSEKSFKIFKICLSSITCTHSIRIKYIHDHNAIRILQNLHWENLNVGASRYRYISLLADALSIVSKRNFKLQNKNSDRNYTVNSMI
jgi:hypothetical protein